MTLPAYHSDVDSEKLARQFFANVLFYRNEEKALGAADDREALLGDMTMNDVFEHWNSETTHKEMRDKLFSIGAMAPMIKRFMNEGQSIEDLMNKKIIRLNADPEIDLIQHRFVDIPASKDALDDLSKTDRVVDVGRHSLL
jgi:hypothetical protein